MGSLERQATGRAGIPRTVVRTTPGLNGLLNPAVFQPTFSQLCQDHLLEERQIKGRAGLKSHQSVCSALKVVETAKRHVLTIISVRHGPVAITLRDIAISNKEERRAMTSNKSGVLFYYEEVHSLSVRCPHATI